MLLIIEGRPLSRVPYPLGVIEDIQPWKEGNLVVGLRFLVNKPLAFGLVLPPTLARWFGNLEWYPLGGRYFPVEGLKPALDEIMYDFREGLDSTCVLFRGDIYGNLNANIISECEYKVKELELYAQALADKLLTVRDDILRLIQQAHEEEDERLRPLIKRLKEIHEISGVPSSRESTKQLKKRLEELEKKLKETEGEEVEEEELGAIDRALQKLRIG